MTRVYVAVVKNINNIINNTYKLINCRIMCYELKNKNILLSLFLHNFTKNSRGICLLK